MGTRIEHERQPVARSPSGLPIRHLVDAGIGSETIYAGEQWLQPGERVLLHTHPVEEVLIFLGGEGIATLGDSEVPVGASIAVHIPAGEVHGFRNTGTAELRVLVLFPTSTFAETTLVE